MTEGANSAVVPAYVIVPNIDVAPVCSRNVVAFYFDVSIGSLKVAAIFLLRATPAALLMGSVEITVGGVTSADAPVEKVHT